MLSVRRKLSSVWNGSLFSQQRYFTQSIIKREIWVSLLPLHLKRQNGTRPSANNLRRGHEIIAHQGTGTTVIECFTEPCVLYGKRKKYFCILHGVSDFCDKTVEAKHCLLFKKEREIGMKRYLVKYIKGKTDISASPLHE